MVEVPPDAVDLLSKAGGFKLYEQAGPHLWFLILNTREGPFKDVRVRQAINYAIDKEALVKDVLQGTATVADSIVPAAFEWAHDDKIQPYPMIPNARALLREAGAEVPNCSWWRRASSGMLAPIPWRPRSSRSRQGRPQGHDPDLRVEHLSGTGHPGLRQGRYGRNGL